MCYSNQKYSDACCTYINGDPLMNPVPDTPQISVILPVYNTAPWLERCLDSLLSQDCPSFEVLAVDDGSTDESAEILLRAAAEDPRLRVIRQSNRGLSAARNAALSEARGQWLMFLDSDDWVSPGFLSLPLKEALSSGAKMVLFQAVRETSPGFSSGQPPVLLPCGLNPGLHSAEDVLRALCTFKINTNVWNRLYHRSLFDGIRFPEGESWEDAAVMHLLIHRAGQVSVIPDVLYHYADRPETLTRNAYRDRSVYYWRYLQYGKRYDYMKQHFPKIAEEMRGSVLESRLKYCAVLAAAQRKAAQGKATQGKTAQGKAASGNTAPAPGRPRPDYPAFRREILADTSIRDLRKLKTPSLRLALILLSLPAPLFQAVSRHLLR